MKYFIAILATLLFVALPLFAVPFLQWYEKQYLNPNTGLVGFYILLMFVMVGFLFVIIHLWLLAIEDKFKQKT